METTTYHEIKLEKENMLNQLVVDCKMFFAFSDKQFEENKTELKEGEKYVSLGTGVYLPNIYVNEWIAETKRIKAWEKVQIRNSKQEEEHILFELKNRECFYTGDVNDAFEILKEFYTLDEVQTVFRKHQKTYNAD